MVRSRALVLSLAAVGAALGVAMRVAARPEVHSTGPSIFAGRSDLTAVPDTPANRRLIDAATNADLAGVRAAFARGADADARVRMAGNDPCETPVAIVATQVMMEKEASARPVLEEIVRRLKNVDAVDTRFNRSILAAAVGLDDLAAVRSLVERGAKLETRSVMRGFPSGSGRTALFEAVGVGGGVRKEATPVLLCLLDKGADPNAADANGATPLMEATMYGKTEVVKALLAHGARAEARDVRGRSALDYAGTRHEDASARLLDAKSPMDLGQAATFGNVARLKTALSTGGDANALTESRTPAISAAVASGSLEAVRLLLAHGADPNRTDRRGLTSLHAAAATGDARMVVLLLEHGADPNAVGKAETRDEPGTPLLVAVAQARPEAVAALLPHVRSASQLDAALRLAVATGGTMPSPPRGSRRERRDPDALLRADGHILTALLKAGADPRAADSRAVALASENGQPGLVELLLARGGSPNGRLKADDYLHRGATALIAAIDAVGMSQGEEGMIARGEEFSSTPTSEVHQATGHALDSVTLLLKRGADPNLADGNGETALMHAVEMEVPAAIPVLLKHGARLECCRSDGRTALMMAASDDHLSLVKRLVALGARVDVADAAGRTTLMLAIDDGENDRARELRKLESYQGPMTRDQLPNKDGHPALVRFLLAHGANPRARARAKDGTTAMGIARRERFAEVIRMLGG